MIVSCKHCESELLARLCADAQLELRICNLANQHHQLINEDYLANYYPGTKRRTYFVNATLNNPLFRRYHITPSEAVKLALRKAGVVPKRSGSYIPPVVRLPSKGARSSVTQNARRKAFKVFERIPCFYCKKLITYEQSVGDHMVPVSRGGSNTMLNIAVCCRPCDLNKGNLTAQEYLLQMHGEQS